MPRHRMDRDDRVRSHAANTLFIQPHTRDPFLLESSLPGVFACGDVRLSPIKRVAADVGEGSMAIAFVHQYLAREGLEARR